MRGSATVDRVPSDEPRLVDNPFRRESHRPWYARRGPRWVVAISVAVLIGLNAFAFKKVGTQADPISVDTAVARFRASSTTQPAPSTTAPPSAAPTAAAGPTRTNSDDPSTPIAGAAGPVGVERGPTPAPGVYVYDTTGYEHIDVLGGAQHNYPSTSTMTVTPSDCGVDVRWTPIEQRFDDFEMCIDGTAMAIRAYTTYHEFFGQSEQHRFECRGVDIRPAGDIPGTVTTGACDDRNGPNHAHTKTTVVGLESLDINSQPVDVVKVHLEQYLSGDMNGSQISDIWLRVSDGLLVQWNAVIEAKGKTVLGDAHMHEEHHLLLTDVNPQQ